MTPHHDETSDFFLVSFLHNQGCLLSGHERVSPRRVQCRFLSDDLESLPDTTPSSATRG
jgi:hypothetical protein